VRTRVAFALLVLTSSASAGDEWQSPSLAPRSSHESTEPPYRLVGVERHERGCIAWVVADESLVHHQRSVNRIILSVRKYIESQSPTGGPLTIQFYRSVHSTPREPSFRITEQLGTYDGGQNKTFFLGDDRHYGSWVLGPTVLASMQPNKSLKRTRDG
jgi:hypothetical protein